MHLIDPATSLDTMGTFQVLQCKRLDALIADVKHVHSPEQRTAREPSQWSQAKVKPGLSGAKTKCEFAEDGSRCRRCLTVSSPCLFRISRRGRIKGSKNRSTIQKLLASRAKAGETDIGHHEHDNLPFTPGGHGQSRSTSHDEDESEEDENDIPPNMYFAAGGPMHDPSGIGCGAQRSIEPDISHQLLVEGKQGSRDTREDTPWNPQKLATDGDQGHDTHRRQLSRNLQHILGEFPVDQRKKNDGSAEKGLQDPLWLITGLCAKGWNLNGTGSAPTAQQQGNNPLSTRTSLPAADAKLLSKWNSGALEEIAKEQEQYIMHGMYGSKRDVAHALDPIHHGLLTEQRATELFQVYWQCLHPQWAILDPALHTLDRTRSRSALLTTTILALASTVLSVLPQKSDDQVTEALRLHAHVEKLNLVVYATAAKSVDIVQAQVLLSRWGTCPKSRLDEQRWMRVATIPRMAAEIGLNIPRRYNSNSEVSADDVETLRMNDIRTRVFMILSEHRFLTFSGRPAMDTSHFELTDEELDEITNLSKQKTPTSLAASYHLFLFDRDVRQRLEQHKPGVQVGLALDAELQHIRSYMERWLETWCSKDSNAQLNWHLTHDAISCWLLLAVCVARKRRELFKAVQTRQRDKKQQHREQQHLLRDLAVRIFEEALSQAPPTVRMTHRASILPFAAHIALKLSDKRDLVLRLGLRMAGEPGRPFVPTFVREAGIQLLLMSRSSTYKPSSTLEWVRPENITSQENSESTDQTHEPTEDALEPSHPSSEYGQAHPGGISPNHPMPEFPFVPDHGPTIFGPPAGTDNLFTFDVNNLPYVPDPLQPTFDSTIYTHYSSAELDTLIGTASPQSFGVVNESMQDSSLMNYQGPHCMPHPFGMHIDPNALAHQPQLHSGQENSAWRPDMMSPTSTAIDQGNSVIPGQDKNPQKEILMATAGWLNQIVSLMQ